MTFTPTAGGPRRAAVTIMNNAPGNPHQAILTGIGSGLGLSPSALNFPDQPVGSPSPPATVTLTNLGTVGIHIWTTAITGANSGDFNHTNLTCPVPPATLAASASCALRVTFTPSATGARSALLLISHDGGGSPSSVSLAGNGVAATGGPSVLTRQPRSRAPTRGGPR